MTDGCANYPQTAVEKFKSNNLLMSKIQFQIIKFGSSEAPPVLHKIKTEMKGKITAVIEP